jgi:hypothetical protein
MVFGLWEKTEAKRLSDPVRAFMKRRFMLTTDYLDSLKCFELNDVFHDEPVTRMRIFSPEAARGAGLSIRKATDLSEHPEMLLFEGYTNELGKLYLADRRMPSKAAAEHTSKTPFPLAAGLWFCTLAHLRRGESGCPRSTRADMPDSIAGSAAKSETQNAPNRNTDQEEEDQAAHKAVVRKKLGSYGPGAGWQPSRDTRDEREWLSSWDESKRSK